MSSVKEIDYDKQTEPLALEETVVLQTRNLKPF